MSTFVLDLQVYKVPSSFMVYMKLSVQTGIKASSLFSWHSNVTADSVAKKQRN